MSCVTSHSSKRWCSFIFAYCRIISYKPFTNWIELNWIENRLLSLVNYYYKWQCNLNVNNYVLMITFILWRVQKIFWKKVSMLYISLQSRLWLLMETKINNVKAGSLLKIYRFRNDMKKHFSQTFVYHHNTLVLVPKSED